MVAGPLPDTLRLQTTCAEPGAASGRARVSYRRFFLRPRVCLQLWACLSAWFAVNAIYYGLGRCHEGASLMPLQSHRRGLRAR